MIPMAMMFPENPELVNTSEKLVYEKLVDLPDSWHIYSNMQQHITLYENVSRGEIDFILKIVARDLQSFQEFLTSKLTSAPNVSSVKTSLTIRTAKDDPGVPIPQA